MAKKKGESMTVQEMARMGGQARAESLTPDELSEAGRKAANAKWANMSEEDKKAFGAKLSEARKKARRRRAKAG